jgi:hypothetical protein
MEAPFRRLIDFWFAAVAWAVHHGYAPVEKASGGKFVSLGPNPNDVRQFEDWRGELLIALAVREFGHESDAVRDSLQIMDLANRYAESGANALLRSLDDAADFEVPILYQVADLFLDAAEESLEQVGKEYF